MLSQAALLTLIYLPSPEVACTILQFNQLILLWTAMHILVVEVRL